MIKLILIVCASIILIGSFVPMASAQAGKPSGKTVWDGVYTADQATRGKLQYQTSCSVCHSPDLSGGEGRPLRGDVFMRDWIDKDLRDLFDRSKTMPLGAPGSLADDVYLEILTYLLQTNAFPAGTAELTIAMLPDVRIESRDGPGAVPNFSLVQVIGCLSEENPAGTWLLTAATNPARTSDMESSKGDQLKGLQAIPLGTQTLQLMYVFPSPVPLRGHKVEVKGLLMRQEKSTSINVTSLQSISQTCGK